MSLLPMKNKTFFTSDQHFAHKNLVKSLSTWSDTTECRDFSSIEDMNYALIAGINSVVGPDDVLYCLGDWSFGSIDNIRKFRNQIVCQNINLIRGNHDFRHGTVDPASIDHGFASVRDYAELNIDNQEIILCHYGLRVWNRQGHGSWHLFGHSHGKLPHLGNFSLDVGVDNRAKLNTASSVLFDPRPWSMDEIRDIFSYNSINAEDGHAKDNSRPLTAPRTDGILNLNKGD
jgi:calcineurin-like phosphoesterase family protein